jgi:ABC-type Na+ efflux pump permease subunit
MNALKVLASLILILVVMITALLCLFLSTCAFDGRIGGTLRGQYVIADLIDIAVMIAALFGIVRLNRKKQ